MTKASTHILVAASRRARSSASGFLSSNLDVGSIRIAVLVLDSPWEDTRSRSSVSSSSLVGVPGRLGRLCVLGTLLRSVDSLEPMDGVQGRSHRSVLTVLEARRAS